MFAFYFSKNIKWIYSDLYFELMYIYWILQNLTFLYMIRHFITKKKFIINYIIYVMENL